MGAAGGADGFVGTGGANVSVVDSTEDAVGACRGGIACIGSLGAICFRGVDDAVVEKAGLFLPLNSALERWVLEGATELVVPEDPGAS